MNRKQTSLNGALLVATTAVLALGGSVPASAATPWVTASDGQCAARWFQKYDKFRIDDRDTQDDDYCYVHYSFDSDHEPFGREAHEQDNPDAADFPINVPSGERIIYWNVCKERQNDPDICSGWRNDSA